MVVQGQIDLKPILSALDMDIDSLRGRLRKQYRRDVKRLRNRAKRTLTRYPGPSVHPFVWSYNKAANDRARRWWFMAIDKGLVRTDGVRYVRSGELGESWEMIYDASNGTITFFNSADGAGYVIGDRQIPGHRRTGWQQIDMMLDDLMNYAHELAFDHWIDLVDSLVKGR